MNRYVIDASVAAKWYLPDDTEALVPQAVAIFRSFLAGRTEILVPDVFFAEIGNVIWKAERRGRCSPELGDRAIAALAGAGFLAYRSHELISTALRLARKYDRTVYDSLYLALAAQENATMITADERLANAVAAHLPVKWLGAD
ncbi:MAG: type II toxin-antitoxin system VapC family toxin [Bryobacteraceae bacterium]